jgi:DSF synthase
MSNLNDAAGLRITYGKSDTQIDMEFEPGSGTIWGYMNVRGAPCFNLGLLRDIRQHDAAFEANGGRVQAEGTWYEPRYYVAGSRTPGAYNLGGDLALFMLLIKTRDRDALRSYAARCLDNLHARINSYGRTTLTTIALVQGDALGGGFESALASDVIVAEESAQMGLPEVMFNLFPGMGAYQLLSRRVGVRAAEDIMLSGRVVSAAKLHELGIVDVLAKDGMGESTVQQWIAANARRRNGTQAVYNVRRICNPITRGELDAVAECWVDAALRLGERDLKMMNWLVRGQQRRMESGEADDALSVRSEPLAQAI